MMRLLRLLQEFLDYPPARLCLTALVLALALVLLRSTSRRWRPAGAAALVAALLLVVDNRTLLAHRPNAILAAVIVALAMVTHAAWTATASRRRRALVAGLAATVALAGAGALRLTGQPEAWSLASPQIYANGCHLPAGVTSPDDACVFGDINAGPSWLLVGDSHAAQWFPALDALAAQQHVSLISMTKSGCPFLDASVGAFGSSEPDCSQWRRQALLRIIDTHPTLVLLANGTESPNYEQQAMARGVALVLQRLRAAAIEIVVIEDTPYPGFEVPRCLRQVGAALCGFPVTATENTLRSRAALDELQVRQLRPMSWLCPDGWCAGTSGAVNAYRDDSHLSMDAVMQLLPHIADGLGVAAGVGS